MVLQWKDALQKQCKVEKCGDYAKTCIFDFYEYDETEEKNMTKFLLSEFKTAPYQVIGKDTTYKFTKMPDVSNLDNKAILKNLIDSILKEKKDILIRDVSVLGFPTFSIIIPGMSEYSFDHKAIYFNLVTKLQKYFKDLSQINLSNVAEFTSMLETIVIKIGYEKLILFINLKDIALLPCEQFEKGGKYFLAIAYIMNSEYKKAKNILEELTYIEDSFSTNVTEKSVVKAVYYYACAMDKYNNHENAMHYIYLLFDEQIAKAIDISFKNKNNIFINHFGITSDDYVENDDDYYLPYMKSFRRAQKDNILDQMKNKIIF